jgi:hypothetical protein
MFANIKKIPKPIQKQDYYLPSGEPIPPSCYFPQFRGSNRKWKFKYLSASRAFELEQDGQLITRRRVEIKAELRKTSRSGGKVSSKTWHLASILERDTSDPIKCDAFWRKIDGKLKTFELSQEEEIKIRSKIEADVPRPNGTSSGQ